MEKDEIKTTKEKHNQYISFDFLPDPSMYMEVVLAKCDPTSSILPLALITLFFLSIRFLTISSSSEYFYRLTTNYDKYKYTSEFRSDRF